MMHDAPVLRAELGAVEIHVMIQAGGQNEAAILIGAIGRQRIFHRDGQHLIRLAALPSIGELGRLRAWRSDRLRARPLWPNP